MTVQSPISSRDFSKPLMEALRAAAALRAARSCRLMRCASAHILAKGLGGPGAGFSCEINLNRNQT